jgi:hypothetical protein
MGSAQGAKAVRPASWIVVHLAHVRTSQFSIYPQNHFVFFKVAQAYHEPFAIRLAQKSERVSKMKK